MQLIRFTTGNPPMVKSVLIERDNDGRVVKVLELKRNGTTTDITGVAGTIEAIQAKLDADVARMAEIRRQQRENIERVALLRRDDYDPEYTADGRLVNRQRGD